MKYILLMTLVFWAEPGMAHAAAPDSSAITQCGALASKDFTDIQDAPTRIEAAKPIAASDGQPAYCQVLGYIWPQVGFELRLPISTWNGKFVEVGCGGFCGNTGWTFLCPIQRGYACIASDMGHKSPGDGMWAYNNLQAQIDWAFRAMHVAALSGKRIVERYYGSAARKAYFIGCSTGGHQGMIEAQRFPWDFDGIIAGAPDYDLTGLEMQGLWSGRALIGTDSRPMLTKSDLNLVHRAALAKCDLDDGVKDGIISNPRACKFDPNELICNRGQTAECLTALQAMAVAKIYSGPLTSTGIKTYLGGAERGSELSWIDGEMEPYIKNGEIPQDNMIGELARYLAFTPAPGPTWRTSDFDFDHDYKRFGMFESLHSASNPDLRKFKAAGGKLIVYHGWQDVGNLPIDSVDYYETVEKTMGGRATTQDFFRLFMIPGMQHCAGGDGAFAIDYLTYLENWVERGHAPDKMIGVHVPERNWGQSIMLRFPLDPATPVSFTRPIYPYPIHATYTGRGDPNKAENFIPVEP
jgi:Tannase and feruloyl esterase